MRLRGAPPSRDASPVASPRSPRPASRRGAAASADPAPTNGGDRARRRWGPAAASVAALAVAALVAVPRAPVAPPPSASPAAPLWTRNMTAAELAEASSAARTMFTTAYDAYIAHAFPADELRPLSCRGHDTQGGVALTLLDSLSTALAMNDTARLAPAVLWAAGQGGPLADVGAKRAGPACGGRLSFAVDARVHTFELTIRALGGLLSAHTYVSRSPHAVPGYGGGLLAAAVDLADRLAPAFDTPTGIPTSWVNLARGPVPGDTRITCTACAGTLTLEFAALSALTGNATYGRLATRAAAALAAAASPATGLVGNTLSVDTAAWTRRDAGVGAGVDSYVEYLLKSYLHTGHAPSLAAFVSAYAAIMRHLAPPPPPRPGAPARAWRVDGVDMDTAARASPWISSLGAFLPGLQALAGQRADAAAAHADWAGAWARFGGLPEMVDVGGTTRHPGAAAYPLRPELAESSFMLHAATGGHPVYRATGSMITSTLLSRTRAPCGHASLADVATGVREDTLESFFLAETAKYLFLLATDGAAGLVDAAVLTTEGHPLPPLPGDDGGGAAPPPPDVGPDSPCAFVCAPAVDAATLAASVGAALPLLAPTGDEVALLRARRCTACAAVEAAMAPVRAAVAADAAAAAAAARPVAQVVCRLAAGERLTCASLEAVAAADVPLDVLKLPRDALVVQVMGGGEEGGRHAAAAGADEDDGAAADAAASCPASSSPPSSPPLPDSLLSLHVTALGSKGEALVDLSLSGFAAGFGPRLPPSPACDAGGGGGDDAPCSIAGRLVLSTPRDACGGLTGPPPPPGAVVAVERGGCPFQAKVEAVAAAGGGAALILSHEDDHLTMAPAAEGEEDEEASGDAASSRPLVPSLLLPASQAAALTSALAAAGDAVATAVLRALPAQTGGGGGGGGGGPPASAVTVVVPPRTQAWLAARLPDVRTALSSLLESLVTSPQLGRLLRAGGKEGGGG